MGNRGFIEPLFLVFDKEHFSDIFDPIWIASLVLLIGTVVLYNVRSRQLHRHEPLRTLQEWLLWTGLSMFGLVLVGALFHFYFLFVFAFIVIGILTFIWIRFFQSHYRHLQRADPSSTLLLPVALQGGRGNRAQQERLAGGQRRRLGWSSGAVRKSPARVGRSAFVA